MRKFWGFYDNGQYKVGCNGTTMYLFDADNREIAKFKDIRYAYQGMFKPGSDIFVLRSTEGHIAIYDCDKRELLKKFKFSDVDYSQDDGFCFSPDGMYFLNIERVQSSLFTRLSIYETENFTPLKRLFENEDALALNNIEYNPALDQYQILYFLKDKHHVYSQGFIGQFIDDQIVNQQPITSKEHMFLQSYKRVQLSGFTEKAMQWSHLHYAGYTSDEILRLRDLNIDMASFPLISKDVMKE